jgi:hypothetical protein
MKEIININNKGQCHGYKEFYFEGKLWYKGFYNNGLKVDYREEYNYNCKLEKVFYI